MKFYGKEYQNKFKKGLYVFENDPEINCLIGVKDEKNKKIISNVGILIKEGEPYVFHDKDFYKVFKSKNENVKNKIINKIIEKPVNPWIRLGYDEIFDLEISGIKQKFDRWMCERIQKLEDEEIIKYIQILERKDYETIKEIIGEDLQIIETLDKRYCYNLENNLFENQSLVDHDILSSCFDDVGNKEIKIINNKSFKITKSKDVLIKSMEIYYD
jgi:hypothetical protein